MYIESDSRSKARARLARGLTATVERNQLKLWKNGQPFNYFRVKHAPTWRVGALYIRNELFIAWNYNRFRRQPPASAGSTLEMLAQLVNTNTTVTSTSEG